MTQRPIFVFNGDADGLSAAHQMRLWGGLAPAAVITGLKRENRLVERIRPEPRLQVEVFDLALDQNLPAVEALLAQEGRVAWFDHHRASTRPGHPGFRAVIDPSPEVCTALLVARHLRIEPPVWALIGLFGDNLDAPAETLARRIGLDGRTTNLLRDMGRLLNYNSYGQTLADVLYPPADLFQALEPFADPLAFLDRTEVVASLKQIHAEDLNRALAGETLQPNARVLPAEPWARRVVGDVANEFSRRDPDRAQAVFLALDSGGFQVSVRAPLAGGPSAAELCAAFPSGGGRAKAAGVNRLPADQVEAFLERFNRHFGRPGFRA